jgi:hypothetical protein
MPVLCSRLYNADNICLYCVHNYTMLATYACIVFTIIQCWQHMPVLCSQLYNAGNICLHCVHGNEMLTIFMPVLFAWLYNAVNICLYCVHDYQMLSTCTCIVYTMIQHPYCVPDSVLGYTSPL